MWIGRTFVSTLPLAIYGLVAPASAQLAPKTQAGSAVDEPTSPPPLATASGTDPDLTSIGGGKQDVGAGVGPVSKGARGPEAAPPSPAVVRSKDVHVVGSRPRGSVVGDIPFQRSFGPLEIRSYGVNDVGALLQTLSPQTDSIRGREDDGPVVLLNGRRISSLAEVSKIPAEAVERVDILPEEVALKYGYRADQKVVNIVLFRRFGSRIAQLGYGDATEGGRGTVDASGDYFRLRGDTRLSLDGALERASYLLESDRNVQRPDGDTTLGSARTLLPSTDRVSLNGTIAGSFIKGVSSTLNGAFALDRSASLLGPGLERPLRRQVTIATEHVGTTVGGFAGRWPWTLTGNYDRVITDTRSQVAAPADPAETARSVNTSGDVGLLTNGSPFRLRAGPVSTSLRLGLETRDYAAASTGAGTGSGSRLSRRQGTVQITIDLPILGKDGSGWRRALSANVNARVDATSDYGALRTFGYGLSWSPVNSLNLIASVTDEEGAPTVEQLGAPRISTPNVPTFDFTRNEFANVTRVFGGNPTLVHDDRRLLKVGLNGRPLTETDLVLSASFVTTRVDDPIVSLPVLSAGIEAAFPQRFARSPDGRLVGVDASPVNFGSSKRKQLRVGLDFTRPLGSVPPGARGADVRFAPSESDIQGALPPKARIEQVPAGSPAAKQIENLSSRLMVSLYHTWDLVDQIVPRPGLPALDLLDGAALDATGGRPRHDVQLQVGLFKHGLGARVSAEWRSGTRVQGLAGGAEGGAGDLSFSAYETVDLNLFANLGALAASRRWLQGLRVTATVSNLFDHRIRVRDASGATPLSYQPGYVDPLGRVATLTMRKIF